MAWENSIDRSSSLFSMFKPERPLIDIPPPTPHSTVHRGHVDPLRTPEDVPARHQHTPWYATNIDGAYDFTPFALDDESAHAHTRFPDVEDAGWDMSLASPPSPSRRTMEVLPDLEGMHNAYDDVDMEEPPTLSPPSPSRRSLAMLPDPATDMPPGCRITEHTYPVCHHVGTDFHSPTTLSPPSPSPRALALLPDTDWQPEMDDCPQLSPPSPIHCSSALPLLEHEFDTHTLFVEDTLLSTATQHPVTSSPVHCHSQPYFRSPSPLAIRLHKEHLSLMSLRDRTMHAERTSRARNIALRGRERELGRAVAALRDAHAHTASLAAPLCGDPAAYLGTCPSSFGHSLDIPLPTPTAALHAYRTLATQVMLERTEEKRRRKKDKERIKELRVVLGVGVDAMLGLAGCGGAEAYATLDEGVPFSAGNLGLTQAPDMHATADLGIGLPALKLEPPTLTLHPPESEGSDLGLAPDAPDIPPHEEQLCVAPQDTITSGPALGLGLGLGLSLESPAPSSLAERTHAMQRLVARMTMRRRDLGMRSLIEAGNMSGAQDEMRGLDGNGSGVGRAGMNMNVHTDHHEKRKIARSALAGTVVCAEDMGFADGALALEIENGAHGEGYQEEEYF